MHKHSNLQSLIFKNAGARQYYNELPGDVRDLIGARGDNINSFGSLIDFAENMLRGND